MQGLARAAAAAVMASAFLTVPLAASAGASPATDAVGQSDARCSSDETADARVKEGADVKELNEVTAARAAAINSRLREQLADRGYRADPRGLESGSVNVDVRMHVITRADGTGGVTNTQLDRQIEVLNQAFSGATNTAAAANTPFRFAIASIDRTANTDWYDWSLSDRDDKEAKSALHQGGADDLNFYITGLQDGLLGYATFPKANVSTDDGVVILNESLPGGNAVPYNKGDTATHEIGHWLNLFHTFQGGCGKTGDAVADTPAQLAGNNIFECDDSLDTCSAPGTDPVHNFMNYTDDRCMDRFTKGQSDRMSDAWVAYRAP
ncbi:MAG: zinc metalloprotease [Nocardioidaceae bacterium]|nr:zinc metalloprotease [Nocardioidaceae bacterium]